jgi:hypothetical protein
MAVLFLAALISGLQRMGNTLKEPLNKSSLSALLLKSG